MDDRINYGELAYNIRREITKERENLLERVSQLGEYEGVLEVVEEMQKRIGDLKDEVEVLRRQKAELEMKLAEMSKLSAGMARKSSDEAVLKALQTYVNRSKRKTADKRAFAKTATLEIANLNALTLPEDLKETIESLDDEQTELKMITVNGNYNDMHDNKVVEMIR